VETISIIAHDPKFWAALLLLANVVLYYFVPAFPPQIWGAIDALAGVIFVALTTRSTVAEKRSRALQRSLDQ